MAGKRLRLTVHASPAGLIRGIVAQPEGKVTAHLVPTAGTMISELDEHGFTVDTDREVLARLADRYEVDTVPARSRLVEREQDTKET